MSLIFIIHNVLKVNARRRIQLLEELLVEDERNATDLLQRVKEGEERRGEERRMLD